jgi:hypothetical protein
MALLERLLELGQHPQGEELAQSLGLDTRQRSPPIASHRIMAAWASETGRIGQPCQPVAIKAPHPSTDP